MTHGNGKGYNKSTGTRSDYVGKLQRATEAYNRSELLKVGDVVCRPWRHCDSSDPKVYKTGVVSYVHPRGYYHTVEFTLRPGVTVRESFQGVRRGRDDQAR